MATRETDGARWERLPPSFRASRGFAARARVCTPLTKPEEKERLLAVYLSKGGVSDRRNQLDSRTLLAILLDMLQHAGTRKTAEYYY